METESKKELATFMKELDAPEDILSSNRPGAVYVCAQLARATQFAAAAMQSRYVDLCRHIHNEQMTPEAVTFVLLKEGFHKARVSEIKRVCFDTDANFEAFVSGLVGFRHAVESARRPSDASDDAEVIRRLRWNKLFASFDRLITKFRPVQRFHVANGQVLLTWKASDVVEGKAHKIEFCDYRVVVEKLVKPDAKEKAVNDKESSNGAVSAGRGSAGVRVSKHKRRRSKLQG